MAHLRTRDSITIEYFEQLKVDFLALPVVPVATLDDETRFYMSLLYV
jgi:hypothetical protein